MTGEIVDLKERFTTGIGGLDTVLKGGLLKTSVYVVVGEPGTGKTILANQISFNHVKAGSGRAIYMTLLAEAHDRMIAYIQSLRFFDASVIPEKLSYVSAYQIVEEKGLTGLVELIREEVLKRKATFLVLDGFVLFGEHGDSELRAKKMIHELQVLSALVGCTILILTIKDGGASFPIPGYTMVDGVIELSDVLVGPRAVRELQVKKLRGSNFLRGKHTFDITDNGAVVYPRTEVLWPRPNL